MSKKSGRRKSTWLVLKHFQKWFISFTLGYVLVLLIVLNTGIYLWWKIVMQEILELAGQSSPTLLEKVNESQSHGLIVLGVLNVIILLISFFHSFNFSKKIAGPIFGLLQHLDKAYAEKKWRPFVLRKGDPFEELPEKLNRAYQAIQNPLP